MATDLDLLNQARKAQQHTDAIKAAERVLNQAIQIAVSEGLTVEIETSTSHQAGRYPSPVVYAKTSLRFAPSKRLTLR